MRMMDHSGRKRLYNDPGLKGIIYHTVKFCDFYSFEYAQIKQNVTVPLLKIESDYTVQSSGQLLTRLEAFAESMNMEEPEGKELTMGKGYFAGIDSGSTSTDVVILDKDQNIVTGIILPTGAGAAIGAERALEEALKDAGLKREDIDAMVTTGYGRTAISDGDKSITEITCHARGAHFLNPEVRTVIDIGGQDSKVIRLDEDRIEERDLNCSSFEIPEDKRKSMERAVEELNAETLFEAYQSILLYNFNTRFLHKEAYFAGIHKLNAMLLELFGEKSQGKLTPQIELLEPESFAGLDSYLQTFRLKTVRLMEQCVVKENPVYYARNQMIRQYVEDHLTDANLSLNETARVMHYTATYFGKYFKEQFGCTFQKYVASRRIECAISLMEKKNMNVQEIALKCGFTNDVTFRRTFKMYVGVTPSQYEKEREAE